MQVINMNSLALAYIGDAIYEVHIRKYLLDKGIVKVHELQKNAVNFVSAKNQSKFLKEMIDNNFFNEQEISVIMRARNNKGSSHPKNTDILTYKHATALEAVIGYLYLDNQLDRVDEIMKYIIGE